MNCACEIDICDLLAILTQEVLSEGAGREEGRWEAGAHNLRADKGGVEEDGEDSPG